jgi:cytochrome c peroxidase
VDMHLHWHIWEPNLTDYEMDRVVDFLRTLTDESLKPKIPERVPSGLTPINQQNNAAIVVNETNMTGESS